ncbi:MAG: peptide-binding protein [Proteobacteria bacterium]|nr:peptide-binding protein [Pseudomonadota bacterium]
MRRLICLWLTLLLLAALLSGCGSDTDPGKADSGGNEANPAPASLSVPSAPEYGGRYVTGSIGEPSNLIPRLASDSASSDIAGLLYVSLLRYNKDLELVPWAAKRFDVLDGGLRLAFELHPGIMWTDGVETTAADVEYTYKMMVDPKTPTAYAESYKLIKEFKVTGRYTFEVTYAEPYARALSTWAGEILPKHLLENENLLETTFSRQPVGNGPYMLKEWKAGSHLILAANPNYFKGRPYFDEVVYRIIPDQATMFLELKAGNLDIMGVTPQQFLFQTTGPEWERYFRKYTYQAFAYTYLGWNLNHPLFQDAAVRRALAHAIDRESLVKGVLLGQGSVTGGPYKPGTYWVNDKIEPYPFDPAKAKALLAEVGWTDSDDDGVLDKDGKPFAFTILTNQGNEQRIKIATIIQSNLKGVGISVKIRTVEWAAFLKEFVDKGNFDALVMGWTTIIDPDLYNVWHSSSAVPGGLNFVGYKNAELDGLLDRGRHLVDRVERKKLYDRAQEILHRDQPYCFLYSPMALNVVSARIQGIQPAPAGLSYNFEEWWIPKSLQTNTARQQ